MKISIHTKLILKGLFHSILQFCCIFTFGWLENCIFEISIIYCCFFIFRSQFEKQYHATTTWLCTIYTFIVFFVVSRITPRKELSLLLIVVFTYFINFVSFHLREYLDLQVKFSSLIKLEIKKGMSKENMLEICKEANLSELETNILVDFYCERKSITNIAIKLSYSYDRIWQIKNETLNKIKSLKK